MNTPSPTETLNKKIKLAADLRALLQDAVGFADASVIVALAQAIHAADSTVKAEIRTAETDSLVQGLAAKKEFLCKKPEAPSIKITENPMQL